MITAKGSRRAQTLVAVLLLLAGAGAAVELRIANKIQWLGADEVLALMIDAPENGPLVVDVRPKRRYERGHVPGAKYIFAKDLWGYIPDLEPYRERGIVLYDDHGLRVQRAGKKLLIEGFRRVYALRGGYEAWTKPGYPVETGAPAEPAKQGKAGSEETGAPAE